MSGSGTIWEELGGVTLLEEMCHWGWTTPSTETHPQIWPIIQKSRPQYIVQSIPKKFENSFVALVILCSEQKVSNTRASCGYGQETSLGTLCCSQSSLCLSSLVPQPRSSCSTLVFNMFASLHWRAWVHCGTRCPVGNYLIKLMVHFLFRQLLSIQSLTPPRC